MALQMLTNVSIAFVYREAAYRSETVSQTHLGEELEILEENDEWVKVRQEDGYIGWVSKAFVKEKPKSWNSKEFFYPASQVAWIYQNPDRQATTIRDMTMLSGLPVLERKNGWIKLLLPDGTEGWSEDKGRFPVHELDVEALVQTALSFLGIQYFWGGRSPKGFDCSGFTQTTFGLHGFKLPRDAYQQAEVGMEVTEDFNSWQVGDLIFFSEKPNRITHVAISLGKGDFIHASGFVKLNSLNPENTQLYVEHYAGIYTKTMRII